VSRLEGGVNRNSSPNAIELLRNVYDCFRHRYAEIEFAIGGTETAEMVRRLPFSACRALS
jgi:pre-mRNA-processing factor 39